MMTHVSNCLCTYLYANIMSKNEYKLSIILKKEVTHLDLIAEQYVQSANNYIQYFVRFAMRARGLITVC